MAAQRGRGYVQRLREAGVPLVHKHDEGLIHEFFSTPAVISKTKHAIKDAAEPRPTGRAQQAAGQVAVEPILAQ